MLLLAVLMGHHLRDALRDVCVIILCMDSRTSSNMFHCHHSVLQDLKEMIQGHLQLQFTREESSDEALLSVLPASLRRRILRHLYGAPLSNCWLFKVGFGVAGLAGHCIPVYT